MSTTTRTGAGPATIIPVDDVRRNPSVALIEGGDAIPASVFITDNVRGEGPPQHVHPYPELFLVEAGTALFTVAGVESTVPAGHVVIVPAATPHGYVNAGDEMLHVVSVHPSRTVRQRFL